MNELLKLLEKDAQLTPEMLGAMLGRDPAEIKEMIDKYEKDGTIAGYSALIDWEKTEREYVTALIELKRLIDAGKMTPALIIGVPVGFVNVVESKEEIMKAGAPFIVARGRKGGSTVAAAICNALLYKLTR